MPNFGEIPEELAGKWRENFQKRQDNFLYEWLIDDKNFEENVEIKEPEYIDEDII